MPLTWMALTYAREDGAAAQAEAAFQQAIAAEDSASPDAATTLELYATFLKSQGRDSESNVAQAKAVSIRKALGAQGSPQTKPEPAYGVDARVATYQGKAALYVPTEKPDSIGTGVYRIGNGVAAPAVLYKKEPEYAEDARAAKYQGQAMLYVEIGTDGAPRNIRIVRDLGFGLGEQAVEAVSQWKFTPGMKDGVAVTVAATVEVNFRLF